MSAFCLSVQSRIQIREGGGGVMTRHGAALDLHKIHIESDVDTGPTTKTGVAGLGSASAAPGRSGTIAWICQCHQTRGHGYPDTVIC